MLDNRLKLLDKLVHFVNDIGHSFADLASKETDRSNKNRHLYLAHTLLSAEKMTLFVLEGVQKRDRILIMTGLRMLLENHANIAYVFRESDNSDKKISKILECGFQYQEAFQDIRINPGLGIKYLLSVPRWTRRSITKRVHLLGEGPEFRYELASKYLHSDIWGLINDNDVIDSDGFHFGLVSGALEDLLGPIRILYALEILPEGFEQARETIFTDISNEINIVPGQTYKNVE
jgi:hypothetical protein